MDNPHADAIAKHVEGIRANRDKYLEEESKKTKNDKEIRCERCNSLVLLKEAAELAKKEIQLPHMRKRDEEKSPEGEMCEEHWLVDNKFNFENVGFTKNVGTTKYLICADCEVGPIGWHDTEVQTEFYVARSRVKEVDA